MPHFEVTYPDITPPSPAVYGPLHQARSQVDIENINTAREIGIFLDTGVSLDTTMDVFSDSTLQIDCSSVLECKPTGYENWNAWYSLQLALASRRLTLFTPHVFSEAGTLAQRRDITAGAYITAAQLLYDAFARLRKVPKFGAEWSAIRGSIGELTFFGVTSALPYATGSAIQGTLVDEPRKIDFRCSYLDIDGNVHKPRVQVKTSASSQADYEDSLSRSITVVAKRFFSENGDPYHLARLLLRDVAGKATIEERAEISCRAVAIKDYVISEDQRKHALRRSQSRRTL